MAAQIIRCLVEGMSIRSTERITGVTKKAISRLLLEIGEVCRDYQDEIFVNLPCKRLQLDEIWSFCYSKERNVPKEKKGEFGYGDVWTWTAIDADTKLMPSWLIGRRDAACARPARLSLFRIWRDAWPIASRLHQTAIGPTWWPWRRCLGPMSITRSW